MKGLTVFFLLFFPSWVLPQVFPEEESGYQLLDVEKMVKAVRDYLLERLEGNYNLEILRRPKPRFIPQGRVEFMVLPKERVIGYCNIPVTVMIDGKEYRRYNIGVKVRMFKRVVVANNRLKRYHLLTEEDVGLEERDITRIKGVPFFEIGEVVGKQTNGILTKGTVLTHSFLSSPPVIKRGEIVTIKREIGLLSVSTTGRAINSGGVNEKIKVENLDSSRTVEGVVEDESTVSILK